MQSLFISRTIDEKDELSTFCDQHGISLYASSLITFEKIPFIIEHEFQALFFSSPRSVMFFLASASIPSDIYIGCVGQGTADLLTNLGYKPDFVGTGSDTSNIGSELKLALGDKHVLMPIAANTLGTVAEQLNASQYTLLPVYRTISAPRVIPICDAYVFTSPSNFESFSALNAIDPAKRFIAWGMSTANAIKQKGPECMVLSEPNVKNLIEVLSTLT